MKEIIIYYSRTGENYVNGSIKTLTKGNTEVAAEILKKLTGADLFQLEQVNHYSNDYNVCINEAKKDQRENARPKLKAVPENLLEYDTIYLGYPNYWGTMPMAVFTFLEQFDFTGKTIRPFCTHEGSGMGTSESDIQKTCPGATVEKGLPLHGANVIHAEQQIKKWIK